MPIKNINNFNSSCTIFKKLFSIKPYYGHLLSFCCLCYPLLKPYYKNKFESKSIDYVFLGYSTHNNGHKCFDPIKRRMFIC
jgi:hypothetical protein